MKPQSDLHSVEGIPWTEIPATASGAKGSGIVEKILSSDPDNPDYCTRLFKMDKDFRTDKVISHPYWEEVWVLKGTLIDEGNKVTAKEGDYCCRHPGMSHGPFYCPEEFVAFEVHYMPKD